MNLNSTKNKTIRIFICLTLSSLIVISLCGFQDIKQKGEEECTFQAHIIDIGKTPASKKMLVVKQTPVSMANKEIYVFITDDTFIGLQNKIMKFDDLTIGMCIEIRGRKVVMKENGQEITDVYARSIKPVVE